MILYPIRITSIVYCFIKTINGYLILLKQTYNAEMAVSLTHLLMFLDNVNK